MTTDLECGTLCSVIDNLEVGVLIINVERRVVRWNHWLAARNGHSAQQADGQLLFDLMPEIVGTRLELAIDQAIRNRMPSLLSPALHGTLLPLYQNAEDRKRNRRMQQLIHVIPLIDAPQQAACLIQINDVTATVSRERVLRQQADNLRRNSFVDPLTGIYNRRKFDEFFALAFAKAQRQQTPLAMIMLDVDHFGAYTEWYGSEQRDLVLRDIAAELKAAMPPAGDILARYDSERFALALPGMDEKAACLFAESLRLRIATLKMANESVNEGKHVTISLGVAVMVPEANADTHTLLSSADVALYQATHEGGNSAVCFSVIEGTFLTCG
jgi:diguanylate cyclase (GGDEF)-like protein